MADQKDRVTNKAPKDAPDGTPLQTTTPKYETPGPEVSHADVDLAGLSLDASFSKTVPNPDPNPFDENPAPGPSAVEVLGEAKDTGEPVNNPGEENR